MHYLKVLTASGIHPRGRNKGESKTGSMLREVAEVLVLSSHWLKKSPIVDRVIFANFGEAYLCYIFTEVRRPVYAKTHVRE